MLNTAQSPITSTQVYSVGGTLQLDLGLTLYSGSDVMLLISGSPPGIPGICENLFGVCEIEGVCMPFIILYKSEGL